MSELNVAVNPSYSDLDSQDAGVKEANQVASSLDIDDIGDIESDNGVIILDETRRKVRCRQIVVSNVFWAVSAGMIPVPLADLAAISAIQLKMVNELSLQYDVRFSKNRTRAIIVSLVGGVGVMGLSWLKLIPGHGTVVGGINVGIISGAMTYAVGQIFIEHFESGGTTENLDVKQARKRMKQLIKEGKNIVRRGQ